MTECERICAELEVSDGFDESKLTPETRRHLEKCPKCRAVWEFISAPAVSPNGDAGEAAAAIARELGTSLKPVKPLPSRRALTLAFLGVFVLVSAGVMSYHGVHGAAGMTAGQLGWMIVAVLAGAGLASISLSAEMAPGEARWVRPAWSVVGFLVVLAALITTAFPWEFDPMWLAGSWRCFRFGVLFSLPAAGLAIAVLRKGAPLSMGATGAFAGLLSGLVGMATVHVGCPLDGAPHVGLGHYTIPLFGTIAGYLIGCLLGRVTSQRRLTFSR